MFHQLTLRARVQIRLWLLDDEHARGRRLTDRDGE
jgi:hypothetical protein